MSRHDLKIDDWDANPNKILFGSKHKTGTVKFQSNADFYFPLKRKKVLELVLDKMELRQKFGMSENSCATNKR